MANARSRCFSFCRPISTNPLLVAPVLGCTWAAFGAELPAPAARFLSLLGAAATPCALVSIGLFLAQKHEGQHDGATGLVLAKLLLQPAITAFLAFRVFELPALWASAALLLSALPTGTGPFMVAGFYARDGQVTSGTILLSTILSIISITAVLSLLPY